MIKGYIVPDGYMGLVKGKYQLFASENEYYEYMLENKEVWAKKQVREIKRNLCINCCDKHFCHGMQSCKDANEYLKKGRD